MALISLTCNGVTWQPTRNPSAGNDALRVSQTTARTTAGVMYGYEPVVKWEIMPLSWAYLPNAEVATLTTFLETTLGWLKPFTFTDVDGSTFTAELDTPSLSVEDRLSGGKAVAFTIRRTR